MENTTINTTKIVDRESENNLTEQYPVRQSVNYCITSFICRYVIPAASYFLPFLLASCVLTARKTYGVYSDIILAAPYIWVTSYVISWVLMYKVRNHNPGNGFGKAMKHIIRWRWIADITGVVALAGYVFFCIYNFLQLSGQ